MRSKSRVALGLDRLFLHVFLHEFFMRLLVKKLLLSQWFLANDFVQVVKLCKMVGYVPINNELSHKALFKQCLIAG